MLEESEPAVELSTAAQAFSGEEESGDQEGDAFAAGRHVNFRRGYARAFVLVTVATAHIVLVLITYGKQWSAQGKQDSRDAGLRQDFLHLCHLDL
jgi:hypothetical protein